MHHLKSDFALVVIYSLTFIFITTTIGLAVKLYSRPHTPPTSTPTPEPKAGISDYASLFAKIDKNLFPPEQYHDLLLRLTECLPNLTNDFIIEPHRIPLSTGETTALLHFTTSLVVTISTATNPHQSQTVHQALTTVVLNCP